MEIAKVLKKIEGNIIVKANLVLQDGVGESLDIVFTDGSVVVIEGNMQKINKLKITLNK